MGFHKDEEIGGVDGMCAFVKSGDFEKLNAGCALDEGLANADDALKVYYGERAPWWVDVTVRGRTGHGSQFIEDTAVSKMVSVKLVCHSKDNARMQTCF
jgi:aminoacylase